MLSVLWPAADFIYSQYTSSEKITQLFCVPGSGMYLLLITDCQDSSVSIMILRNTEEWFASNYHNKSVVNLFLSKSFDFASTPTPILDHIAILTFVVREPDLPGNRDLLEE